MGMGRDNSDNSLPDTSICPILVPSGTLWAGGGDSLISSLIFCFAFAVDWITAKMADDAGILYPYPVSTEPESRIPVFCSYLLKKKVVITKTKQLTILSLCVSLNWRVTPPFTLCKPQVFSLKSCKKCGELGYQKSLRQNLLIVLISFLNICIMLLHTMFRPNFTFETRLLYIGKLTKRVFFPPTLK